MDLVATRYEGLELFDTHNVGCQLFSPMSTSPSRVTFFINPSQNETGSLPFPFLDHPWHEVESFRSVCHQSRTLNVGYLLARFLSAIWTSECLTSPELIAINQEIKSQGPTSTLPQR